MQDQHDLTIILESRVPLVAVETHDELRFMRFLSRAVLASNTKDYRPLFRWSVTDGLQRIDIDLEPQTHNAEPDKVLRHIRSVDQPGIYVLLDFHPFLSDPIHVRLLKDIALHAADQGKTLILLSHQLDLPSELDRLAARFEMSLPDDAARAKIVATIVNEWNASNANEVQIDQHAYDLLVRNLAGLTRTDTERLARNAIYYDGAITQCDLPAVAKAKYELLNSEGILSFEYDTAQFADIGGLGRLKHWLQQRKVVLVDESASAALDPPRGLMLLGVQGCGKSLGAKATAALLDMPLLRLDFGALYNKYHGETERNLRESLRQAELMAPCVLWIDEVEKGLSTSGGDDGLSRRVLGTFLTWLAEKQATVFVVATANDISQLPPELLRKGRFDEIFFVDLPSPQVRLEILQIHLRNRELDPGEFDLVKLVAATDGFSGAEIEQGIVSSLYTVSAMRKPLNTEILFEEFRRTRPLSVVMAEKLAELRTWATDRTVPAD